MKDDDLLERIDEVKRIIEERRAARLKAEARLEDVEARWKELEADVAEAGIDVPKGADLRDVLADEVEKKRAEVEDLVRRAEEALGL